MIIDSILGMERYYKMNERFEKAFIFLRSNNITTLETGRYDIDGDNVYAIVSENDMKSPVEAKLEVHNLYIDIQIPVSTSETFGWKDRSLCNKGESKYDAKKDIAFFEDSPDAYCVVKPLQIVLFFPHDAHAPLIGNEKIKKIVIKVKV
ncbi:MAG: YhcH/YjgK/YiaL family protein [Dysgonamonadaceae bacterium]|jgi:YhcH/YjgK/YiaL family protein|nr:YhcH/YjgK/YiaL family protein [Dysgonamonadaceae bacterium]